MAEKKKPAFKANSQYLVKVNRVVPVAGVKLRPRYEYTIKGSVALQIEDAIKSSSEVK